MSESRLVYIPTNRECILAIDQQLEECAWAARTTGDAVTFCVIESETDHSVADRHRRHLRERQPDGVSSIHLGRREQEILVQLLINEQQMSSVERRHVKDLLLPSGTSYGRGPNIASLFAAALGAGTTHRRDSDEYRDISRDQAFAVEMELRAIGRDVLTIPGLDEGGSELSDRTVAMVGTSVFGDPTIDRKRLLALAPDDAVKLQALGRPGVSIDAVAEEAKRYLIDEVSTRYRDDFFSAEGERVEMGSCAITSRLASLIPEMPTGILGCDYMRKDLAWRIGWPVVFHSRKVQHIYDDLRWRGDNVERTVDYSIRDLQYLQVGLIWQDHGSRMSENFSDFFANGELSQEAYAQSFRRSSMDLSDEISDVRVRAAGIYLDAAKADPDANSPLHETAVALVKNGEKIDSGVQVAISNFAALVEYWPALTRVAESLGRDGLKPLKSE